MKINEQYQKIVNKLNNSKSKPDYNDKLLYLLAWTDGVTMAGGFISEHMANVACAFGHPVKAGVWQDWEEKQ